jgi:hypothetical protein
LILHLACQTAARVPAIAAHNFTFDERQPRSTEDKWRNQRMVLRTARKNRSWDMIPSQAPSRIWAIPFLIRRRATFVAGSGIAPAPKRRCKRSAERSSCVRIWRSLRALICLSVEMLTGLFSHCVPFSLHLETRKVTSLRRQIRRSVSNCALLQRRRTEYRRAVQT